MPRPKKMLAVLPNPWAFIDPELGPQGRCHYDTGGRGGHTRFVGAELDRAHTVITEVRDPGDPRHSRQTTVYVYKGLTESLLEAKKDGADIVARSAYYFDRLRDGDLIPADDDTRKACVCKFSDLKDARKRSDAVVEYEASFGKGSLEELLKEIAADAKQAEPKPLEPSADLKAGGSK